MVACLPLYRRYSYSADYSLQLNYRHPVYFLYVSVVSDRHLIKSLLSFGAIDALGFAPPAQSLMPPRHALLVIIDSFAKALPFGIDAEISSFAA